MHWAIQLWIGATPKECPIELWASWKSCPAWDKGFQFTGFIFFYIMKLKIQRWSLRSLLFWKYEDSDGRAAWDLVHEGDTGGMKCAPIILFFSMWLKKASTWNVNSPCLLTLEKTLSLTFLSLPIFLSPDSQSNFGFYRPMQGLKPPLQVQLGKSVGRKEKKSSHFQVHHCCTKGHLSSIWTKR